MGAKTSELYLMSLSPKAPSRRYFLQSVGATLSLPTLHSLLPNALGASSALGTAVADAETPNRMVAIGNLLGFQLPYLFPKTPGNNYESTRLLKPLEELRNDYTLYRGLDHGVKGGHHAVHSFMTGVLTMDAKGRPDGNISLDQMAADCPFTVFYPPDTTYEGAPIIRWGGRGVKQRMDNQYTLHRQSTDSRAKTGTKSKLNRLNQ